MPTPFIPALPGTIRGPFQNSEPRTHFMVRTHTESWIPVMAYDRESEAACQRRAQEIANKITQEQPSKMPHREATNYFQHEYQAVRYYRTYGSDEAEVQRKIRDGEITIGEPPEKLGAIRRAPGGHFHYEFPDVPAPDKTEAQLRAEHKGLNEYTKIGDAWGDDKDPKVIAKSTLEAPVAASTPDTPVIEFLRSCTLDGLTLHVPSARIDPKVYAEAKKALLIFGGKWNTGKQCFSFKKDPSAHIATLIGTGKVVNEKKNRQAFYTPEVLANQVAELADVREKRVLEPSAGHGSLADACRFAGAAEVVCIEMDADACAHLRKEGRGYHTVQADFLAVTPPRPGPDRFARVVMNPPFAKGQFHKHIDHAFRFLAPGGVLVAITPDVDCKQLDHLTPETVATLPAGEFQESGTGVATRIIRIRN